MKTELIRTFHKAGRAVVKHSPMILTVLGVAGIGATTVATYKASRKVEVIIEDVEFRRRDEERLASLRERQLLENGINEVELRLLDELERELVPVQRFDVAKDIAGVMALPVALGVGSVVCIGLSYHIQNNRIVNLAAAIATAQAEKMYYSNKYKAQHGEEAHEEFYAPVHEETTQVTDEDGTKQDITANVRDDIHELHGAWFDQSEEYARDDHDYNMQFVRSTADSMDFRLFRKGYLLMNEVRDALGLPRTKLGALVGWSVGDFNLYPKVTHCLNKETGQLEPQIYCQWSNAKYIYDNLTYEAESGATL